MSEVMEAYGLKVRKARKAHKCIECGVKIEIGESYNYHHGVFDGKGVDYKCCFDCDELRDNIDFHLHHDDHIGFGELSDALCDDEDCNNNPEDVKDFYKRLGFK